MSWLVIVILAYFLFAIASTGDKYLLLGPPNPKTYTFYVGILGLWALCLIPFVDFFVPGFWQIILCLFTGVISLFALFAFFNGMERFEATRIIPAIGGLLPICTFILTYFFSGRQETLSSAGFLAFAFLVLGAVLISKKPGTKISYASLKISMVTAVLLALFFVLSKYVYLSQPFWNGFIWIRIGVAITAAFFIFTKDVRKEIFHGKFSFNRKTGIIFVLNQAIGGVGFVLQNWAVALAGFAYLAVINALQGIQYAFLFLFALLLPKILKEEISKKIVLQKILAILIIGAGLMILTLS